MTTTTIRAGNEVQVIRLRGRKVPGRSMQEQKNFSNYFSSPPQKPKGLPPKEQRYRQTTPRRGLSSKALPSLPKPPGPPPVSPASLATPSIKIKVSHGRAKRTSGVYMVHTSKRQRRDDSKTSQELRTLDLNPGNEIKYASSLAMKGLERAIGPQKPRIVTEAWTAKNLALQDSSTHPAFRNRHQHSSSMPAPYISTHPALRNRHQHSSSVPNTSSMVFQLRAGSTSIEMVQPPSPVSELSYGASPTSRDYPTNSSRYTRRPCDQGAQTVAERFSDDDGYSSTLCSPLEISGYGEEFPLKSKRTPTNSSDSCYTAYSDRNGNSDFAMNLPGNVASKAILTTGEEVIDLYLAGFLDDGQAKKHCVLESPLATRNENRGPKEIAHEVSKTAGGDLFPSIRPFSFGSKCSAILGNAFQDVPSTPPPLQAPTVMRDQYGFLKASHQIANAQYDTWNAEYSRSLEKRTMRWFSYMKEEDLPTHAPFRFPRRCAKTERFVRKGIPPMWRGAAWFWYAGGDRLLQRDPDLYSTLVSCSDFALNNNDKEMIERDLHRTFPDNIHFKPDVLSQESKLHLPAEAPLLCSLRRVLQAFALYCPRIGYCQSLNFIAGLLLLFLSEEKTFWMLRIITTEYLPGTHDVSLEGANVDLWILMNALKEHMPSLWTKIGAGDDDGSGKPDTGSPPIGLCTTSWFMSLFIGTLPIESVLRVWDVLFYEGSRTIFRVALAIFRLGAPRLRAMTDPMEIFQAVQALPRRMLDANSLMRTVCRRRGGLSEAWVVKRRAERRRFYVLARAKKAGGKVGEGEGEAQSPTSSVRSKADSVWRRRIGGHRS